MIVININLGKNSFTGIRSYNIKENEGYLDLIN